MAQAGSSLCPWLSSVGWKDQISLHLLVSSRGIIHTVLFMLLNVHRKELGEVVKQHIPHC